MQNIKFNESKHYHLRNTFTTEKLCPRWTCFNGMFG